MMYQASQPIERPSTNGKQPLRQTSPSRNQRDVKTRSPYTRNQRDVKPISRNINVVGMKEKEYYPHHQHPPYFDSMAIALNDILESNSITAKKKRNSTDSYLSSSSYEGDCNVAEGVVGASFTSPKKSTSLLLQHVASLKSMLSVSSFAQMADPVTGDGQSSVSPGQASSQSSLNASLKGQSLSSPPSSFFSLRGTSGPAHPPPPAAQLQRLYGPAIPPTMDPNSTVAGPQPAQPHLSQTLTTPITTLQPQQQILQKTPLWRQRDRLKTVNAGLVLALNIGTDPPKIHKPNPHAKLQAWYDPTGTSRGKAREIITQRLEDQYTKWNSRTKLKIKKTVDPTAEDVRILCQRLRREARGERVLLHYNGHGVPRATAGNGELWVFDKKHTQYLPLSARDLRAWVSKPSMIVLDCHGAGALLPFLIEETPLGTRGFGPGGGPGFGGVDILSGVLEGPGNGTGAGLMPPGMHSNMRLGNPVNMTGGDVPGINPPSVGAKGGEGREKNMARGANNRNNEDLNIMNGNHLNVRGGTNSRMNLKQIVGVEPNGTRLTGNNVHPSMNFFGQSSNSNTAELQYQTVHTTGGFKTTVTPLTNPNNAEPSLFPFPNTNVVNVSKEEVDPDMAYAKAIKSVIVLCPVSANEDLPLNPELPGKFTLLLIYVNACTTSSYFKTFLY